MNPHGAGSPGEPVKDTFIQRIIEFCAVNRYMTLFAVSALCVFAVYTFKEIRLDALPDLSDTQVIVYSKWDRSPDIIEDQVTYPIVAALLGAPNVKAIRGFSDFGFSYVYVIFQDGTDIYWARSRVLEYLSKIQSRLPQGVQTELGPDATGVGWIYQYALVDRSGTHSLDQLRSYQDWTLRYALQSVPGVAEVASIGGFQKQYQVTVDPNRLASYGIPLTMVTEAIRMSNNEVGGRLIEFAGAEYMVRGRGYTKKPSDLENVVVKTGAGGAPVLLKDIGRVAFGPEIRRGVSDLDGLGDHVGGIVVMRHGENALNVIERVKARMKELEPSLPKGVEFVPTYDRSDLIHRAIGTLKHELILEMVIVALVILLFLWHAPSAMVPIITIPVSVLLSFIPLYYMGVTVNIMSIAGIAISIGVLVDGAIVEVENAYNKIYHWDAGGRKGDFHAIRLEALKEVGPSVFFSLLVIAVAFLPVFTLVDQEGRLFKPLAYSKNLAMALAALLAITLNPAQRMMFARIDPYAFKPKFLAKLATHAFVGKYYSEERHPISRRLFRIYEPACRFVLRRPKTVIAAALVAMAVSVPVYFKLGSEFMPPLNEGTMLYMPTTLPGLSVAQAQDLMIRMDKLLKSFPEVERVFGKAGRADTSTDPAPFSMMETTVVLKDPSKWSAEGALVLFVGARFPEARVPAHLARPHLVGRARDEDGQRRPLSRRHQRLDDADQGAHRHADDRRPHARRHQGVRQRPRGDPADRGAPGACHEGHPGHPLRVRRAGDRRLLRRHRAEARPARPLRPHDREAAGRDHERHRRREHHHDDRGSGALRREPALPEGAAGRSRPARAGARPHRDGGAGAHRPARRRQDAAGARDDPRRERLPGRLRLRRYRRPRRGRLRRGGEEGRRIENLAEAGLRAPVERPVREHDPRPRAAQARDSGDAGADLHPALHEHAKRVQGVGRHARRAVLGHRRDLTALYLLGYNVSIAAWVGMIALMGLDAETGVFMMLFLDLSYDDAKKRGLLRNLGELDEAIIHGAVKRVRPKMMTVAAAFMGLLPIMWSTSAGPTS